MQNLTRPIFLRSRLDYITWPTFESALFDNTPHWECIRKDFALGLIADFFHWDKVRYALFCNNFFVGRSKFKAEAGYS